MYSSEFIRRMLFGTKQPLQPINIAPTYPRLIIFTGYNVSNEETVTFHTQAIILHELPYEKIILN